MSSRCLPTGCPFPGGASTGRRRRPSLPCILAFLAVACALTSPGTATAQGLEATVIGQVLDAETDTPVDGAVVTAAGVNGAQLTDELGQFRLQGLRPGSYEIGVQHVTYGLQTDTLVVTAGETIMLEFRVAARPIAVAGILVTARSRGDVQTDVARGTRFDGMSSDEVDRVRTRVSTMADLVAQARVPGLLVRQQADSVCIESNRFRRRFSGQVNQCNTVQVVVDDVLLMDPTRALAAIDPQRVDRFELVPPIEAGVLYGDMGRYGVLRVYTEDGRGPALGYEDFAPIGPRWAFSLALSAQGGSTIYDGTVRVRHSDLLLSTPYTERTTMSPGLEGSARWNTGRFGFLGVSVYGNVGQSTGTFERAGGSTESFERDFASVGSDVSWAFSLHSSSTWNAQLGLGPSFSWQKIKLSQGNSSRIANVNQSSTPAVSWSDRSWFAPGGHMALDLTYDLGYSSGVFIGAVFRALGTGGNLASWSLQEEQDVLRSTGTTVEIDYSAGIATSLSLRTGFRWYPGSPLGG